ncbi:TPA: hypothetical protein ACX6QR_000835 [Photobacterium damselae]
MDDFKAPIKKIEDCDSLFIEGEIIEAIDTLSKLTSFIAQTCSHLSDNVTLLIDDEKVEQQDFANLSSIYISSAIFKITIDTKRLVQETCSGNGDIDEYLFTSLDAFKENFTSLGLSTPLCGSRINKSTNTRIHIYGLDKPFGGSKLAVVPTSDSVNYGSQWLQGSELPQAEVLLKQVHLITSEKINLDPKNFELSWGQYNSSIAHDFKIAFAQHLLIAMSSNYYSINKVQLKGVKHIDAHIEPSINTNISNDFLDILVKSIKWIYSVEDSSIPLQLFIDRLSLEYNSNDSLLDIEASTLSCCLEQAKNNYKFVIAKRSEDYRKELKDIYSDIKTITDKFMDKSAGLSSELLKSLLTIGFVFTVGTISKAIVNEKLLHSAEGILLFKLIGIYLIASFFIRWLNASAELKISYNSLRSWSKRLHNHISTSEVNKLITKRVKWSRIFYLVSLGIVTFIQCLLGLAAYYSQGIFWYLGI